MFPSRQIGILFWMCIIDLATTVIGIEIGVFSGELNPILNVFFTAFGIAGLVYSKLIFTILPIVILTILYERHDTHRKKIDTYCTYGCVAYIAILSATLVAQT